jgi:hypothetical protein
VFLVWLLRRDIWDLSLVPISSSQPHSPFFSFISLFSTLLNVCVCVCPKGGGFTPEVVKGDKLKD